VTKKTISEKAAKLYRDAIVCDMTVPTMTGIPGESGVSFPGGMELMARSGITYGALTVRGEVQSIDLHIKWIARARNYYIRRPDTYVFVASADDIPAAKTAGKLAVNFNLQGTDALLGDVNLVETYRRLGVGHMLIAYNRRSVFGDGCHERGDCGLSKLGVQLVEEMNRVGMIVDCSHCSYRTTMDIFDVSKHPVIFSHSNPKALFEHDRNITDDQAARCAETGGVIGVNGVGMFMSVSGQDVSSEMLVRQIDHYVRLVGPAHVGIGLDCVHDLNELERVMAILPDAWPDDSYRRTKPDRYVSPDQLVEVTDRLLKLGYDESDVRGILGENWLRVMREVWSP